MAVGKREQWVVDLLMMDWVPWRRALCALAGRDLEDDERNAEREFEGGYPFADWPGLDDELRRVKRHLDSAIRTGEVHIKQGFNAPGDSPLDNYLVSRDDLVRLATKTPGQFPGCPFIPEDLPNDSRDGVPHELRAFVSALVEAWREAEAGKKSQKELAGLLEQKLEIGERVAEGLAAVIRPPQAAVNDRRRRRN